MNAKINLHSKYSEGIYMDKIRFKAPSAVFGIITNPDNNQILLQKRKKLATKTAFMI